MQKNKFIIITIGLLFALLFNTCKKYPDGGYVNQTCKNLFGGSKAGNSKTWKLKYYEVNGIDSTNAIQGPNNIPDFFDKFVTFTFDRADPSPKFTATSYIQNYSGSIAITDKVMVIGGYWTTHEDSVQCKVVNNQTYCQRNIFKPEFAFRGPYWDIKMLTKTKLVITTQLNNFYKITLSQ